MPRRVEDRRDVGQLFARVARFLLTANGKEEDRVDARHVSVQGDITPRPSSDHQFPEVLADGATDQWVALEHINRLNDIFDALARAACFVRKQMPEYAIEVIRDFRRQLYARHNSIDNRFRSRPCCLSAAGTLLEILPHVGPANRLPGGEDRCVPLLGSVLKFGLAFIPLGLFGNRFEDESVWRRPRALRGARDAVFQVLRQANRGRRHRGFEGQKHKCSTVVLHR